MAIQTSIIDIPNQAQNAGAIMYEIKEFLVNSAGWTVAGSSDGATGGMDNVDRIVGPSTIDNSDTWVVLETPHATASDRVQILLTKISVNALNGMFRYNPQADWVGATTALPTSAYESADMFSTNITDFADTRIHILADDAEPYGFASLNVRVSTQENNLALALVPLAYRAATSPGKPYVFIADTDYSLGLLSNVTFRKTAEPDGPPQVPVLAQATTVHNSTGMLVPNGTPQTSDNRDQSSPVIFHSTTEHFGVSTFMLWNGSPRNNFDNLEDDVLGTRGRIVFGDVNFPWDGVTVPDTTTIL